MSKKGGRNPFLVTLQDVSSPHENIPQSKRSRKIIQKKVTVFTSVIKCIYKTDEKRKNFILFGSTEYVWLKNKQKLFVAQVQLLCQVGP